MATLYVGTSQSYQTVADAVAAANAGDTVIIKGSEYTATDERVTVSKSLTLKAEGDVTMRGLNIGGKDFDFVVDGINFVASEADASGVTGYANNASCISQVGTLRNVTIENCTFDLTEAGMTRTYGIFLSLGTWGFENLTVRNNVCEGYYDEEAYAGYGLIYAANVNNADVSNNTITYAASHAIQLSLSGKTYLGSGEQTIKIDGNIVDKSYACAVYCADLHNSDMTVEINDNVVSNVQEGSCGIYHGAIRIGQSTISGVEISGNVIDGAQVGIYNAAAIKEGSDGSIVIENNAMSVSQIHPAEDGVTPVVSGLGGTAIPEGTADNNLIVEDAEIPVDSSTDTIYVNNNWSAFPEGTAVVANGKVVVIGTNAFADVNAAAAVAEKSAGKLVVMEGANVTYTANQWYLLNTPVKEIETDKWSYDYVVDASETYDLQIDGTLGAYQVLLNNAETVVSTTGKLFATGEVLRVMGGSITVEGNRESGAGAPDEIFTGSWGGGTRPGADTQIKGGYMQINQGAVADFNNTVVFVNAGWMNFNDAAADFSNTYIYLGSGGSYAPIAVELQNGAEVTFADNTTVVNDNTFTMNITVDATSTLTLDASSSITATTLTVADGGKFIIDATGFEGVKKVVDLAGESSLEGKVTINGEGVNAIYGADGDVTLVNADTSILYVNSEYADLEFGTAIEGKEGVFVGVNAFGDFDSAVAALKDNNTTIALLSNATMSADPSFKLNVISGDGNDYQLKIDSVIDVDAVFAKEIDIDTDLFMVYYNNHNVVVNGDLKGGFYNYIGSLTFNNSKITDSYDNSNIGGVVNINGDGSWTMENAQADNLKFINVGRSDWLGQGILNLNDTVVKAIQFSVDSSSANAKSQINAVNSTIATVLNDGMFGDLVVGVNGEVNLTNSKLNVAGTLNNNGAVNVTGESSVYAKNLIGNGIVLNDATLSADSNIGGDPATKVYGTSVIKGTVGTVHANWTGVKENGSYIGYTTDKVALSLDGATTGNVYVGSDTEGYGAELTVSGGSTVGGIYCRVYGSANITGSDNVINYINAKGSITVEDAEKTEIESMVAEGATINIIDSDIDIAIGTNNNIQLDEGTTMEISGSTVDIQQLSIDATSALKLTKTTFTVDDVYDEVNLITNNGSITIDGFSTLTADSIALGENATITIDADGFSGTKKVIDLAGTSSLEGKVTVEGEGITAIYGEDGDVTITNVSTDTLFVNAAWADKKAGDVVGEGLVFGVNAFASSKDALTKANELGGEITVDVTGMGDDNDEDASNNGGSLIQLTTPGTYTITGGAGATSKLYGIKFSDGVNVVFDQACLATGKLGDGSSGSLTVKDSVVGSLGDEAFAGAQGWFTYKNTAVKIENSIFGMRSSDFGDAVQELPRSAEEVKAAIAAGTYTHPAYGKNHSGANFGTLGTVDVDDSTMYTGYLSVVDRALMTVDNSVLYYGGTFSIGAGEVTGYTNNAYYGWDVQHSELSWVNPPHASAEGYREGLAAQVDITDSILYNVGYGDGSATHGGTALQVGGYFNNQDYKGILNITRSEVNLGKGNADAVHSILDITANGTVNMEDSSLVAEKVINSGDFFVNGENTSTLNIATLTGNAIEVTSGGLKDSTIGTADDIIGNVIFSGNAALEGTNKLAGVNKVVNGSTLTIDKDAEVTAHYLMAGEDNYFAFGNDKEVKGGTIDIEGKLNITQNLNANANGVVNIKEGAEVKAAIVAVENGEIADAAKAGVLNVDGKLQSTFLNVFSGGEANINESGYVQLGEHETDQQLLQLGADSTVNVAGELNIKGSGTVTGTLNVNGGDLTVEKTLTNNGSVKVSGSSVLDINKVTGNVIKIKDAVISDSVVGTKVFDTEGSITSVISETAISNVYGNVTFTGTNFFDRVDVGRDSSFDKATVLTITGDFWTNNMLTGTVHADNKVYIGQADVESNAYFGQLGGFGAIDINNANVDYHYAFIRNAFTVKDSTLNCTSANTYWAGQAVAVVDNSTWNVGSNVTIGSYGGSYMAGNADVTLQNKSTYTAGNLEIYEAEGKTVKLTVNDSTVNATTSLTVSAGAEVELKKGAALDAVKLALNGTLTMDATSTLTVSTDAFTMGESASIVIDAAGLVGVWKVIDLNSSSMEGNEKITFINNEGENFVVEYLADGDIVIGNVAQTTLYVDSAWADEKYMADLGDGKYFGFNAFATVDEAVVLAATESKVSNITVSCNNIGIGFDAVIDNKPIFNITTANENGLTVDLGNNGITFNSNGDEAELATGTLNNKISSYLYGVSVGEKVTVNADLYYITGDVDVDGTVNVTGASLMAFNLNVNGNLNVSDRFVFGGDTAIVNVAADGNFNAKYLNSYNWNVDAEINVAGSAEFDEIDFGGTVNIADGGKFDVADKMKLNKLVNQSTLAMDGYTAEITEMVNDGTVNISAGNVAADTLTNNSTMSITGGKADAETLTNNGTMSISGGNLAADSVENTGSLTATGDSVMEFGELVNDGDVVLKDNVSLTLQSVTNKSTVTLEDFNGTLKGFVKAEDKAVTGNIKVLGNTSLADTVDTALLSVGSWDDFSDTVAEGDKLTVAENGIVSASNLYVQGGGVLDVQGEVNVIGHYNGVDGIFANYGTTNVSGVMSVTNEASCGYNQIGGELLDNSKIALNILDGGVFNLNTTAGVTEADKAAKLNIVDGAELNIFEGGTFNSDEVSVVDNNGTVNVGGTANITNLNNYGEVEVNGKYNGNNRFTNGGTLTVADGELKVSELLNGIDANNAGSIVLTGEAVLDVVDTLSNSYNGTINMDADSLIKVNKLDNKGTLNVSVKRDGVWMIIDGAEGVTDFGSVTVNGITQGNLLFNDEANGDLYLVNTKSDALYFNAEWSENLAVSLGANTFKDTKLNGNDVEIKDGVNAVKFYNGAYSDYTINKDVAIETLDKGKVTMNLTADANVSVVDDTKFEMAENSTLTVSENGSVTVAAKAELVAATVVNDGAVTVDGTMTASSMTNNGTLTLNSENAVYGDFVNNGDVEIAETGKFTATGEFVNDGKFTVNVADDMEGAKLVIDLAEDREFAWNDGDITFNVAEGMNAFYDANGDVAVSNAQMDTYVFNNAWAGSELADLVDGKAGKDGFYYGINAFDDVAGMDDEQHADEKGELFAEKLTFYAGKYTKLDLAQDMTVETVNGEAATMDVTTTNELAVESKFNLNGTLSLNGADAMLDVAEGAEATFGNIKLDDAAVKESSVAGTVTVVNDADIRNMTVAADGSMTVEGTANILGNTAFNVLGEFNAGNMVIGETFAEDEEAVATTVNVSGVNGKVVSENVTVNANAVLNITGTDSSFTCNGIIDNDGVINVTDAKLSAEEISNIGTAAIVISGNSTVNAVVTGNGSLRLVDGAVLDGVLTAPVLYVEGSASFAENASFTGMINGRTIYVSGDKNVLDIAMDSKATLVVADGTVFTDDNLGDIAIKGEKKDVVLTVADEAFNGNTLENVMLNIVDVEGDRINVSIDLDKVLTIDGYELKNVNGVYYYEGENGNMFVGRMEENGKYFIQLFDGTEPGASTVEDVKNIKVNDNDDYPELANVNVRMKEGNTTISVTGKKSDIVEFAVGSILKSEKGGSNTVKFGNYTDVSVNGSIESLAKLTIGNNAKVTVGAKAANGDFLPYTGNITGQNKNNAVKIGSDSTVDIAGTINLMGGKNTMAVGARSTVTVGGSVKGISALTVASGKAAANNITDLDIDGMFVAAAANNKITIGNYARFTLGAVDGVSIENGGVESATGTTISVGKESAMIVEGSANGIAKLTAGKNAIVTFGGNIDGTEKNNAVKIGEAARFMAADIDLAGGKNSISTGKGSEFSADVVSNVQTITVGTQSTFEAESISGVNKITVSAGKAPKKDAPAIYTNVVVDGDVVMTTGKDSFKVGSYSNVAINGNLTFGDGKDTLTLGKDAQLLAGDIEGMEVFNASKGAKLIVLNGQGDDVDLDAVSGSWKNATIIDGEGLLQDVNTGMVYANERDMFEYDLTGSGKIALENFSEGMEIYYSVADANDVYGEFQLYTEGTELTAGSYRFEVSVAGEYTDKLEKKNYSFTVAELA